MLIVLRWQCVTAECLHTQHALIIGGDVVVECERNHTHTYSCAQICAYAIIYSFLCVHSAIVTDKMHDITKEERR